MTGLRKTGKSFQLREKLLRVPHYAVHHLIYGLIVNSLQDLALGMILLPTAMLENKTASVQLIEINSTSFGSFQKSPSPSVLPHSSKRPVTPSRLFNEHSFPSTPAASTASLESSHLSAYSNPSYLEKGFEHRLSPFSTSSIGIDSEKPLPSIERIIPSTASGQVTGIEDPRLSRASPDNEELNRNFQNFQIGTPGRLSTPRPDSSINVSLAAFSENSGQLYTAGSTYLSEALGNFRIGNSPQRSTSPFGMSRGQSVSPSTHSRSNSNQNRSVYRVEDEEPPATLFYTHEVQEALQTGKTLMSGIAGLLANPGSNNEAESVVQNLLQQASELARFELHSSRTVGLIGDIGVGKSSTINSLLDCGDLAQRVS